MSCNFPMIRCETYRTYKNSSGGISYEVEWAERQQYDSPEGRKFLESKYRRVQPIPCGQCIECRLDYAREWATRVMLHKNNGYNYDPNMIGPQICRPYPDGTCWFITVTYSDEYLPQSTKVNTETGEIHRGISLAKKRHAEIYKATKIPLSADENEIYKCWRIWWTNFEATLPFHNIRASIRTGTIKKGWHVPTKSTILETRKINEDMGNGSCNNRSSHMGICSICSKIHS